MVRFAGPIRLGDVRSVACLFLSAPLGQGIAVDRIPLVRHLGGDGLVDTLRADLGSSRGPSRISALAAVDAVAP